ncbi:MAG: NAD(P)/FAD-dependent oxidoreductase [Acidobacteriota bacterium]
MAIVGGGPAGLATAICASLRGLSTIVLERRSCPPDKACGEGIMPAGVRALQEMGALPHIKQADSAPFIGIRYVQEDGSAAEGRLPRGGGLGVRRTALSAALSARAAECGVELRWDCTARRFRRTAQGVSVELDGGEVEAGVLVAADGLNSPLRAAEGLERPSSGPKRFGLRQHFRVAPWNNFVEVHFGAGIEAYVTPSGAARVGIAFLWERGANEGGASIDAFLARFPVLASRVACSERDSEPRGAGPMPRLAAARVKDRFVLIGDAAGYVDPITGEGTSLAFACSRTLGEILPAALKRGATVEALRPYERAFARKFRRYALVARAVLALARRPRLRCRVVRFMGAHPRVFETLVAWGVS